MKSGPNQIEDKEGDLDLIQAGFASFGFASSHNNSLSNDSSQVDWLSLLDKSNVLIDPRTALSSEVISILDKGKPLSEMPDLMESPPYAYQILFVLSIHISYIAARSSYPEILKTGKFSEMIQAGNGFLKKYLYPLSGIIYGYVAGMHKLPAYQLLPVCLRRYLATATLDDLRKYLTDHLIPEDISKLADEIPQLRIESQAKNVVEQVTKRLNFKVPRANVSDYWYRKHLLDAARHFFSKLDDPKLTKMFIDYLVKVFDAPSTTNYQQEISNVLYTCFLRWDIDTLIESIMPDGVSDIKDSEIIDVEKKEEKLIIKRAKTISFEDDLKTLFLDVFIKFPYQAIPQLCNRVITLLNQANLPAYEVWNGGVETVRGSNPNLVSLVEIAMRMQVKNELKMILADISKDLFDATKASQNIHTLFNSESAKLNYSSITPVDPNDFVPTIVIDKSDFKEGNKIEQLIARIDAECLNTGAKRVDLSYPLEVTLDNECVIGIWVDKRVRTRTITTRSERTLATGATHDINRVMKLS
ncbi:MAG: hypothetical protein ABI597_03140 [Gammaproteobacteria bacterium]